MYSYSSIPKGLRFLLVATVAAWVVELLPAVGGLFFQLGALIPVKAIAHLEIWRFATYLFLHDTHSPMHLLFNMLALWMFGVELEEVWGTRRFVTFYFLSGIGSGLFSIFSWYSPVIGASGAILALLTVYACYFPDRTILLFFIFPVPVRLAVLIIGAVSLWGAWTGAGGIAYLTHLGGIAVGYLYYKYYSQVTEWWERRSAPSRPAKPTILEFRRKENSEETPSSDEAEIDRILDKISRQGMESLTDKERKKLQDASKKKR
jgi:membrane associated rhomboid family serine protease